MTDIESLDAQIAHAARRFAARFGRPARFAAVAPGRVNLIGEHTDYNDGFVLPMAIQRQTLALADRAAAGGRTTVASTATDTEAAFVVDGALQPGEPSWANYMKGVLAGCLSRGLDAGPLDVLIDSTVPFGGGLSSSAALSVAAATLVEAVAGRKLEGPDKALLCQKAEHVFAGTPCGIMDPFISAMAQRDHALLLDCRDRTFQNVPLLDPAVAILVIDSRVKHELSGGQYALRRAECERAARQLGVGSLRDATMDQLLAHQASLDPTVYRRALHVIGENQRTTLAAGAAGAADWETFGGLMAQSHYSLRDHFEVSCVELDLLVEEAMKIGPAGGVLGSRMTGAGFGGCTVSLIRSDAAEAIARAISQAYRARTGVEPAPFVTRPAQGARAIDLP